MSSSPQGEFSALIRVHSPVWPKSLALAMAMKPCLAATLASEGIASSRLPSTTSTWPMRSLRRARILSLWGGTKWIMRSSLTGNCRKGSGAPMARGAKCLAGVREVDIGGSALLRCNKATLGREPNESNRRLGCERRHQAAQLQRRLLHIHCSGVSRTQSSNCFCMAAVIHLTSSA